MWLPFCCHTKSPRLSEFLLPKQTWSYPTLNHSVVTPPIPSDPLVNGAIDHPHHLCLQLQVCSLEAPRQRNTSGILWTFGVPHSWMPHLIIIVTGLVTTRGRTGGKHHDAESRVSITSFDKVSKSHSV